jgi:precorrin-2 methylase
MIYIIGSGPGDPELITMKGYRILRSCDVILGLSKPRLLRRGRALDRYAF